MARLNHVWNRDAGGGWRYIYWQKWRIILLGVVVTFLIGLTFVVAAIAPPVS